MPRRDDSLPLDTPDFIVPVDEEPGAGLAATLTSFPGASWSYLSPSDTNLAKSGQRVMQVVNSQIRLYNNAGNILHGRILADFFGAPDTGFEPFDPRAVFDRLGPNHRFYVAAVQYDPGTPVSASIWLAVSRSANPANLDPASWCIYRINSLRNAGTAHASWSDFPGLGVGADTLLLTTNQHRFSNRIFSYAILRAINKATLSNNAAACPNLTSRVYQPSTTIDNLNIFTIQPAVHSTAPSSFPGTANPAYAISAKGSPVGTTYTIFRVRNMTTANPTLTSLTINAASFYAYPPDAPQRGTGAGLIETGETRILNVSAVGDSLWAGQSTECTVGPSPNEACVRVFRINLGQNSSGTMTATLAQQITFGGGQDRYFFMPAVAANDAQRTVVVFLRSNDSTFVSSVWTAKAATSSSYPTAIPLTAGSCTLGYPPARVGDFLGAQVDPTNGTTFWITGEHPVYWPPGSQQRCVWATTVAHVN